jgi:hypothetical protein
VSNPADHEFEMRRKTPAESLRYLAAKLRDGALTPDAAAMMLEVQATLMEDPADLLRRATGAQFGDGNTQTNVFG